MRGTEPRLHLDADTSMKALHEALLARGHDVTRTPNEWMALDADDETQLLGATAQNRSTLSREKNRPGARDCDMEPLASALTRLRCAQLNRRAVMRLNTWRLTSFQGENAMSYEESIISPRLICLQQELEAGNDKALELFWKEISERGTPLIEPVEGDENQSWVTFLWRTDDKLENVTVISQFIGQRFSDGLMSHLPNTDVWYKTCRTSDDLRITYSLSPNDSLVPVEKVKDWKERTSTWQHDPLNPRTYVVPKDDEGPEDVETILSVIELSSAPPQPWIASQADVPAGQVELHRLRSSILDNERRVWIYTPPGYGSDGEPYGLLVLFDGWAYINLIPTSTILDNLLAEGLIPPLVAVLPDSLSQETRSFELACYAPFADFLVEELVPWVRGNYNVTTKPSQMIVGGSSLGGLAAVFAGLKHPSVFGNVLSQSAPLFWRPEGETEHEWLPHRFAVTDRLPLQFHLDVGLHERHSRYVEGPSLLVSNQHLRDILQAKGYTVHYVEYNGGHDYICWRGTLAEGLAALVGKDAA